MDKKTGEIVDAHLMGDLLDLYKNHEYIELDEEQAKILKPMSLSERVKYMEVNGANRAERRAKARRLK